MSMAGAESPASSDTPSLKNFNKALKTLPSCQRCQKGRRRCDTLLPSCSRCARAKEDCLFYDHALKQVLPRSYVHSLLKNAEKLQSQLSELRRTPKRLSSDQSTPAPDVNSYEDIEMPLASARPAADKKLGPPAPSGFHFPVTMPQGPTVQYFGPSSVFSLAVHVMRTMQHDAQLRIPEINNYPSIDMQPADFHGSCNCSITRSMVERSVDLYMKSIHVLYPFLDEDNVQPDLKGYWDIQSNDIDPAGLKGQHAHQFFRIKTIAAIASASRSRYNASRIACDHGCYVEVVKCIAEVTSEVSADSLRALLLLIIYCLFRPRKGDIWRLLDYACRLCLELGYHTETGADQSSIDQQQQKSIFWSLYAIEKIVCQLFGRPSDFPDTIVTAQYPTLHSLPDVIAPSGSGETQFVINHYRLVSLRSKLFSELYLLDEIPSHDLPWYQTRLDRLDTWYLECAQRTDTPGMGQTTCTLAFHATVLFLFQPLVMETLNHIQDRNFQVTGVEFFPSEILLSASRLIEVYEEIMKAPRNSTLGTYPITFMSAHYIFLASLMLVGYCLVYLDGRIPCRSMSLNPEYLQETQHNNLENICQLSNSCLVLLTLCSDRFPGLIGMTNMFQSMSGQMIKHVPRKYYTETAQHQSDKT